VRDRRQPGPRPAAARPHGHQRPRRHPDALDPAAHARRGPLPGRQRPIKFPPKFFLGAAASPFASDPKFQALREHKKVNAGAQFFQTNLVYDVERMQIWLNEIAKRNILDKVYIMIGITPLKSAKMTHYMTQVPGVYVPMRSSSAWTMPRKKADPKGRRRKA
jgi:5,10-methylenetetrahydrofolate reductase